MIVISTETYKSIVGFFKRNKPCNTVLKLCYNFLPLIMFVSYGILIVFMFFSDIKIFARITLSPLTVFAIVTFFRKIFNRPRPYEKFATTSVFGKNKKGESMPSRHTACAFIIAMACKYSARNCLSYNQHFDYDFKSPCRGAFYKRCHSRYGNLTSLRLFFIFYNLNNRKAVAIQIRLQLLLL